MKKLIINTLLCINVGIAADAQNWVTNPSFEDYNSCPTTTSSISYSSAYSVFPTVNKWMRPTGGTSDYLNVCAAGTSVGIPSNSFGYQVPRTGNGYAGIITYAGGTTYSEYLETKLTDSMVKGRKYFVSFFVSLAEYSTYSTDRIAVHFSNSLYYSSTSGRLSLTSDITSPSCSYITDTIHWINISGYYTAAGGERWMIIGKFADTSTYRTITVRRSSLSVPYCYLYIDDVSVLDLRLSDTTYCVATFPQKIYSSHSAGKHLWNTGDTAASITVSATGKYWCADSLSGITYVDTIRTKLSKSSGLDTIVCLSYFPYTINNSTTSGKYKWNTGDTTATLKITAPGTYWRKTIDSPCVNFVDTFKIRLIKTTGIDTGLCVSSFPYTLSGSSTTGKYKWNTGDSSATLSVRSAGTYWRNTIDKPCINYTDTFKILPTKTNGFDTAICASSAPAVLTDPAFTGTYLWSTGTSTAAIPAYSNGTYFRKTTFGACISFTDTFKLQFLKTTGMDTLICDPSFPLKLHCGINHPCKYLWMTGDSTYSININDTGLFTRTTLEYCSDYTDTMHVTTTPKPFIGNDSTYCFHDKIVISSDRNYGSYYWNTGETTRSIYIRKQGEYIVAVSGVCGIKTDTVNIGIFTPALPAVSDATACLNDTGIILQATGNNLLWYTSLSDTGQSSQPVLNTSIAGQQTFYVSQTINNCTSLLATVNLNVHTRPIFNLGNDTSICDKTKLEIGAPGIGDTYSWNTGDTSCCIIPKQSGTYILQMTDFCGAQSDTIHVQMFSCDCVSAPSAFSPNGDGKNDYFHIISRCPVRVFTIHIYNRFGQLVFTSGTINQSWDGNFMGVPVELGSYFYYINYAPNIPGEQETIVRGEVTVVR